VTGFGRVARNTAFSAVGDLVTKIASLAFFVVLARELGTQAFGHYTFALSITVLLTTLAGFGTDSLLTREVARRPEEIHNLYWTSLAIKLVLGTLLTAVCVGVSAINGYPAEVHVTVALLGIGCIVEALSKTVAATFLAHDDTRPSAAGLIVQRFFTAFAGIAALAAGARLVPVAAIYVVGAILGYAYVSRALRRRGIVPRRQVSWPHARSVSREAAPFGFKLVFSTAIFRVDATILSLLKDSTAVGHYGAAYRLLESVLFIPYAFEAAAYPMMSRLGRDTTPAIGSVFATGLKAMLVLMTPIGLVFLLYAGELLDLLYGSDYAGAETALMWLGGAAALYGVSFISASLISAQGRIKVVAWATFWILLANIGTNLVVIPRWSLTGAAAVTTITELAQTVVMLGIALRITGRIDVVRALAGPAAGAAAMAAVALALPGALPWAPAALAAYAVAVLAVERTLYPADLGGFVSAVRSRLGRA
jgi:O-antigen/teichoic acid export membrane protein